MHYFDSHAHLTDPALLPQVEALLTRAFGSGVTHILNICTSPLSLQEGLRLSQSHPTLQNAGATTPHDVAEEGEKAFPHFAEAARAQRLRAIGETGLDYHYYPSTKEVQQTFLRRYLHLAEETQLPVLFHCREAFADLFAIVDAEYPKKAPAVLHCFTGTIAEAEGVIERGWFLSLSGIVTFKKSEALREVAKEVPLSQLLIETDSPYLAPQSLRGKPNEPAFLPEIAACIAAVKQISLEEIARVTSENAKRLFRL